MSFILAYCNLCKHWLLNRSEKRSYSGPTHTLTLEGAVRGWRCVFGPAGGAQSDCLSVCISILFSFALCFSQQSSPPIAALLAQTDKLQLSCLCSLLLRRHFVYECNLRFITWHSSVSLQLYLPGTIIVLPLNKFLGKF